VATQYLVLAGFAERLPSEGRGFAVLDYDAGDTGLNARREDKDGCGRKTDDLQHTGHYMQARHMQARRAISPKLAEPARPRSAAFSALSPSSVYSGFDFLLGFLRVFLRVLCASASKTRFPLAASSPG